MNKKLNLLSASALLGLTFTFSAMAGHSPISSVTGSEAPTTTAADGHTPISSFTDSSEGGKSLSENQFSESLFSAVFNNLFNWR